MSWPPDSDSSGFGYTVQKNFMVFTIEPYKSNYTGIALFKRKGCGRTQLGALKLYYKFITRDTTLEDFLHSYQHRDTKLAFYFPEKVMHFLDCHRKNLGNFTIFALLESSAIFFPTESIGNKKQEGLVFKISIKGTSTINFGKNFIPILFENKFQSSKCEYWGNQTERWEDQGVKSDQQSSCVLFCQTDHLTYFTKVIDIDSKESSNCEPVMNEQILSKITEVCLILSVIGVIGIFVIAGLLKRWRKRTEVKIFMQLNVVTLLQIVIFFINSESEICDLSTCIAVGSSLQYIIIAQLFWMSIYTVFLWLMNYKPFTYASSITHGNTCLIARISLIGWIAPAIPVALSLWFGRAYNYTYVNNDFCFPTHQVKLWGFVVVIFMILVVNTFFYFLIGVQYVRTLRSRKNIRSTGTDSGEREMFWQMVILIFVVGLPWTFGVLHLANKNHDQYSSVFTYLFCAVVPSQGFLIFLSSLAFNGTMHDYLKNSISSKNSSTRNSGGQLVTGSSTNTSSKRANRRVHNEFRVDVFTALR